MSSQEPLSSFLIQLKEILSPQLVGNMDSDYPIRLKHITSLKEYVITHKVQLSIISEQNHADILQLFYLIFELIDYFGILKTNKEIQIETYNFSMEFLKIFGVMFKYSSINPQGTKIFYRQIALLDNQFYLYTELFPDLFTKVEAVCSLSSTSTEVMKVNMMTCMFHSSLTRIIVNYEAQVIKEEQSGHLTKSLEHILKCQLDYLGRIPKESITEGFRNTLWELIYRVELSPHLFLSLHKFVAAISEFLTPEIRTKQQGRMALRVAILSSETDLRQVLLALKCFQFPRIIEICQTLLIRLDINGYFTSDHDGSGAMCFNGFSMKFNEIADEILTFFEKMCIWNFCNAHCAGEIIAKTLVTVFNLPAKKGWEGPWIGLNDRTINLINTLAGIKDSDTISKLFDQ